MKRALILVALMVGALLLAAEDDKSTTITVKGSEVASGVIIINVAEQGRGSYELHCNKGFPNCNAPDPGTYTMVRLPKNWGMYDCTNVDLYPTSVDPASGQKVGQYCLEKK